MKNLVVRKSLVDLTIEDCMDIYERRGYRAICNDGVLEGFVKEKSDQEETLQLIWLNKAIN